MAKGSLPRRRTPIEQPDTSNTKVGQKRYAQKGEYDGQSINSELDYVHERINQTLASGTSISGAVIGFAGVTPPQGWLLCDGTEYNSQDYPELFAAIGVAHGGSGGTFRVPDYRGRFLRGVDDGAGVDPNASSRTAMNTGGNTGDLVGSIQADAYAAHTHQQTGSQETQPVAGPQSVVGTQNGAVGSFYSTQSSGGSETRPKNAYIYFIIKT